MVMHRPRIIDDVRRCVEARTAKLDSIASRFGMKNSWAYGVSSFKLSNLPQPTTFIRPSPDTLRQKCSKLV